MRFLSVCSGIEAASVAWTPLGWEAVAFSEIEPFSCAVLAHHYPIVPNWGDMTKFQEWPDADVDLLCGGTPCQSFSVAGLRKGLADPRGNLMLTFGAIAAKYRPRWLVWENVPGVLSSNGGRDFGAFLGMLGQLGYGFAYRVLDAQYFGVPQRRRRVFVVGCLGDWRRAAAVLFERHSMSGDSAPRREAGKVAPTIPSRSTGGGGLGTDFDCDGGLIHADPIARCDTAGEAKRQDWETCNFVAHSLRGEGFDASEDGTGRGTPLVPVAFTCKDYGADAGEIAPTLRSMGHDKSHANAGGQVAIAFNARQDPDHWRDRTGPLDTDGGTQAVSYAIQAGALRTNPASGPDGVGVQADHAYTLEARAEVQAVAVRDVAQTVTSNYGKQCDNSDTALGPNVAIHSMQVRRLTPTECARLQGFPEIQRTVEATVWFSGHQKPSASAETKSLKSQRSAFSAAEDLSQRNAKAAELSFSTKQDDQERLAVVHVRLRSGILELQTHSPERSRSSASFAESKRWSPLPMPHDGFARLVALTTTTAANARLLGEVELQVSASGSIHRQSGRLPFALCGQEIAALAADAVGDTSTENLLSTYTTYRITHNTQSADQTLKTLFSYVAAAIAGFIPEEIKAASSYVVRLETNQEYLDITYRSKPAADGPKYKALGNSWAVPVVRWIGERIQRAVDPT